MLGINGYQGYSGGGFAGPGAAAGTAAGFGAAAPQVRKRTGKCFLSLINVKNQGLEKKRNFMFLSAGCSLLRAEGFFYGLCVLLEA